jgi:hypothetical protein
MPLAVANSDVGSMPEPGQPFGQRHHLGGQKAEQQLAQLAHDPIGAWLLFQAGGDVAIQAPMSSSGTGPLAAGR